MTYPPKETTFHSHEEAIHFRPPWSCNGATQAARSTSNDLIMIHFVPTNDLMWIRNWGINHDKSRSTSKCHCVMIYPLFQTPRACVRQRNATRSTRNSSQQRPSERRTAHRDSWWPGQRWTISWCPCGKNLLYSLHHGSLSSLQQSIISIMCFPSHPKKKIQILSKSKKDRIQ